MRIVVVTGPSGAGKTFALHSFEDAGFYTIDNLPPRLLPAFVEFCENSGPAADTDSRYEGAAVVIDIRSGADFAALPDLLQQLEAEQVLIEILFLDASDATLVQRFKETRRPHPLLRAPQGCEAQGGILEAIQRERTLLETARTLADSLVDTSAMSPTQLRAILHATYAPGKRPGLLITVISFGFKHGLPIDADLVFDVRFLRNPHYVPDLKPLTGRDAAVAQYVHEDPLTNPFEEKMADLVRFTLPQYAREGKAYLNIAIGCTGGRHRSVVLAEDLMFQLRQEGFHVAVRHRDVNITPSSERASYALPSTTESTEPIREGQNRP